MGGSSVFSEQEFETRLENLRDSQESISSLSSWCLSNREHHKKIVTCWLDRLKRVGVEQRLPLFHLANDVIQYSKRNHYPFVDSWGTALQKATTLVRDDRVRSRVMRIFQIWDERRVYDEAFISDLRGLLTTNIRKKCEPTITDSSEFQPMVLVGKIRECKMLEEDTDLRFRKVKENSLQLIDANNMRTSLKDRRHGSDVVAEVDHGVKKMEAYVKALELEIAEREKLIEILHQAALFYETQRGEARLVVNAYRAFGSKLKVLKNKLDELIPTLSDSPIPSPDINAPSPSPDSDIELPCNDKPESSYDSKHQISDNGFDFNSINTSFMGNPQFLDISLQDNNFVRPIEVISNSREQKDENEFSITDFIKSLLPTGVPKPEDPQNPIPAPQTEIMQPLQPPPMPPLFTTSDAFGANWKSSWNSPPDTPTPNAPWNQVTTSPDWSVPPPAPEPWPAPHSSDTPESPPLYEKEGVNNPVEYDDSIPAPSAPDVDHRTLLGLPRISDMDHRLRQDTDHRIEVSQRIDVDHRKLPKLMAKDIDHRNLITLTGSPKKETKPLLPPPAFVWPEDEDYRSKPDLDFRVPQRPSDFNDAVLSTNFNPSQPPPIVSSVDDRKDVNVESIDMDVSEEDEEEPNSLIQLEDDVDDRLIGSMDSSFLNQSNLTNFNMSSSFINNMSANVSNTQDVDERLKSIFGGVTQNAGAKIIPPEFDDDSVPSNDAFHSGRDDSGDKKMDNRKRGSDSGDDDDGERMEKLGTNGFGVGFNEHFRRDLSWAHEDQLDQIPPPCQSTPNPPRGVDFPGRMRWNSPRTPRARAQHRFPYRPHTPRPDLMMRGGRIPFRPRLPIRGGRW